MYLLKALIASIAMSATLPHSVLFGDAPATIEQMKAIEGRWVTKRDVPVMTLSIISSGWMSLEVGKGLFGWINPNTSFPVAITTHEGQLFINIAVRSVMPEWDYKWDYQGKECYGTSAVMKVGDGIDLLDLDEDKIRAANSWYPKVMPAWEGGFLR